MGDVASLAGSDLAVRVVGRCVVNDGTAGVRFAIGDVGSHIVKGSSLAEYLAFRVVGNGVVHGGTAGVVYGAVWVSLRIGDVASLAGSDLAVRVVGRCVLVHEPRGAGVAGGASRAKNTVILAALVTALAGGGNAAVAEGVGRSVGHVTGDAGVIIALVPRLAKSEAAVVPVRICVVHGGTAGAPVVRSDVARLAD